jgi:hypothetical protein
VARGEDSGINSITTEIEKINLKNLQPSEHCLVLWPRFPLLCSFAFVVERMKHILLAALLVAWLAPLAAAQPSSRFIWQRSIETPLGAEQARQMIKCRAGGYLICGRINDSITTIPSTYVVKLDEQGQTVWEHRIKPDQNHLHEATSIVENRSGQILVATSAQVRGPFPYNYDARIDLLSPAGQPIWNQEIASPLREHFAFLRLGNDGNFVGATTQLGEPTVFKMDSTGRYIWQQAIRYDSANAGVISDVLPVGGGYVAVHKFLLDPATGTVVMRLVRLDENGTELYRKPAPRNFDVNYRSCTDRQGNILYAHGWLSRVSSQLDTLWTKYSPSYGSPFSVAALSDGNTLLLGLRFWQGDYNLSVAKVAPSGQIIGDTILFRFPGSETPADIVEDTQGNYVFCGNTTVGLGGNPAILLAKMRPWRQTLGLPETTAGAAAALQAATLYPNPAQEIVFLHSVAPLRGALVLRDALGRAVRTYSLDAPTADAPFSLAGLPAGLYLLSFTGAVGVATRTWRVVKTAA